MQYQGRWRSRINWFIPVASSTLVFEKLLSFVSRSTSIRRWQFSRGDSTSQTLLQFSQGD